MRYFFKLRSNRYYSLFLSENLLLKTEFATFWLIYPGFLELYLLYQYKIESLVKIKNLVKSTSKKYHQKILEFTVRMRNPLVPLLVAFPL